MLVEYQQTERNQNFFLVRCRFGWYFGRNIVNIDNSLDKVSKLNGVYYNWTKEALEKNKHLEDVKEVGVVAQDVEAVLPELVATREDGSKAVRYERLCAVLIESVKELKKEIEELKKGA